MAKSFRFFVTCPTGFEHQLARELSGILGSDSPQQKQGGAEFTGSFSDSLKVCLWSRIAGKVLLALEDFHAENENDVYESSRRVRWSDFFSPEKTIAVDCTSVTRDFKNTSYLSLLVKDGISDHFRGLYGKRPDVDREKADVRINLFASSTVCTLSLDLSGGSLHERGYRVKGAQAPLRENLAAALLERAGWGAMAFDDGKPAKSSLLDPMCGSGTFLIEAAMIASRTAPGLKKKDYCFRNLKLFRADEWRSLVDDAAGAAMPEALSGGRIRGLDIDQAAVEAARRNIREAGFEGLISVERCDIREIEKLLPGNSGTGLVALNLPYGKRLGSEDDLPGLYRAAGEKIKNCFNGWNVLTVSGSEELSRALGMKPLQTNTVYNGPIKCVSALFKVDTRYREKQDGAAAGKGAAGTAEKSVFYSQELANRLNKNMKSLKKWREKEGIECYRLYDADIPEYSAAIDVYGNKCLYIQEYSPPAEIPPAKSEKRLEEIIHTASRVTGIPRQLVQVRRRRRQNDGYQYSKEEGGGEFDVITEGGLSFYVNFTDYLDTGIFLDHRIVRQMIREMGGGRKFLNLFSYTATASVYACAGGSSLTVSVDSNKNYCQWAENNFTLNSMPPGSNRVVRSGCIEFLEAEKNRYDIIFIDPPTFSNSKSREGFFDIQTDHPKLIKMASEKLLNDGIIIFSSNFKKFKLDDSIEENFRVTDITEKSVSPDFQRRGHSRRCWIIAGK